MKKILLLMCAILVAGIAMAKENKTATVNLTTTPQMHCAACENVIKKNLRFEKGVKKIETNVEEQRVTVTYDTKKTNVEKLCKGFEKFGYTAREMKDGEKVEHHMEAGEKCGNM